MIVSERKMNARRMALGNQRVKPCPCAARQRQGRRSGRCVHHADVFHMDAGLEAGADGL